MIWKKYSESAKADIISIFEYISYELASPKAAERIFETVNSLKELPMRHQVYNEGSWRTKSIRFVPVDKYIIFYMPDEKNTTVNIVRIIYGGRDMKNQS